MKFVAVILLFFTFATHVSAESQPILRTTKITTTTTTVTTTTATKVIDTGMCNEKYDLYSDGVYLKTLCMVAKDLTYEKANTTCTEAGMNLFVVNNNKVQEALQDKASIRFLDRDYARLWVNGKKNFEGSWKTFDSEQKSIFQELQWLQGDSETGQCLSILRHNKFHKMTFQGWTCSGIAWGYCEYIHPLKIEEKTWKHFNNDVVIINV